MRSVHSRSGRGADRAVPVPTEFDLIREFFADATSARPDVPLGIGDDCALLRPPAGKLIAQTTDTLVAGRHFLADADPEALGHKALAVNLSDLAAMGAEPAWASLALTLPQADPHWLQAFMAGLVALAGRHDVQLVGGDTTRGPLSITIQVQGFVEPGRALRRDGAAVGDRLFVSGSRGDAALALAERRAGQSPVEGLARRLDRPEPRVALGRLLGGRASAAIDVSDGLLGDLNHICERSGLGARCTLGQLPLSAPVAAVCHAGDWRVALAGGDDYELLFCVPPDRVDETVRVCEQAGQPVAAIGEMVADRSLTLVYPDGQVRGGEANGFDHFQD